ncbi:hypothetical protein SESBI_28916 [Sesbania bispinosa]|nr:hypothetical protein SESBI_28916 [Sesbania bispinosa]
MHNSGAVRETARWSEREGAVQALWGRSCDAVATRWCRGLRTERTKPLAVVAASVRPTAVRGGDGSRRRWLSQKLRLKVVWWLIEWFAGRMAEEDSGGYGGGRA